MACTAQELVTDARCLVAGMNDRQLLAAIACLLADSLGMACDPQTLVEDSRCLWESMSERQLLASIALSICNGGGGGGGTIQVYNGAAPPAAPTDPTKPAIFYPDNDALPLQVWDTGTLAWRDI